MSNPQPAVSLIIPVYNEAESIDTVITEANRVLNTISQPYEILVINDGSTDETASVLAQTQKRFPVLRILTLTVNAGQSAAFGAGFRACHGYVAILMDGDGQNDPHDIPAMLAALKTCDACCGIRAKRQDSWSKRVGSRMANAVRRSILHDGIKDTGCSLKAIKIEFLRTLPMELKGMHRFLPALLLMQDAKLAQLPVNHRPRAAGQSKYTNLKRLSETASDLWAVRWMQKRYRRYQTTLENDQ